MTFRTPDKSVRGRAARPVDVRPRRSAIIYDLRSRSSLPPARLEAHWRVESGDGRLVCGWRRANFAPLKLKEHDDPEPVIEPLSSIGSFSFCPAGAVCSDGSLPSHAL